MIVDMENEFLKPGFSFYLGPQCEAVIANTAALLQTELIVTGVASNVCVYQAVLGFHVRHYRTVLALDCTAGARNAEEFVISQLGGLGYNYNVTLSTSHRITIVATASTPT